MSEEIENSRCSLCYSILGTPFYVMEYAQGRLFKDPSLPGMTAEERKVHVTTIFATNSLLCCQNDQATYLHLFNANYSCTK